MEHGAVRRLLVCGGSSSQHDENQAGYFSPSSNSRCEIGCESAIPDRISYALSVIGLVEHHKYWEDKMLKGLALYHVGSEGTAKLPCRQILECAQHHSFCGGDCCLAAPEYTSNGDVMQMVSTKYFHSFDL